MATGETAAEMPKARSASATPPTLGITEARDTTAITTPTHPMETPRPIQKGNEAPPNDLDKPVFFGSVGLTVGVVVDAGVEAVAGA